MSRWRPFARSFVAVMATLSTARGEDLVNLEWNAPPGCPRAEVVQERIRTIVGDSPKKGTSLAARGRITREGRRFRLALIVEDRGVERERIIDSNSCHDLAGAAAVALGLLLKVEATSIQERTAGETGADGIGVGSNSPNAGDRTDAPPEPEPAPTRSAEIQPKSATDDDESSSSDDDGPSERALRFVLKAPLVALDVGQLPTSEMSFGAGAGIRHGSWHASVVGRIFEGQTLWASSFPEVGAEVEHLAAELWLCRGFTAASFEFSPCLTLGAHRFSVAGTGPRVTTRTQTFWVLDPGAALAVHLHAFDWFALFAWAGASVETARPHFEIEVIGKVGQLGAAKASFGLGSEWIF